MSAGREIDRLRGLGFDLRIDGDDLLLRPADAEAEASLTPERRDWLAANKAALVALLRSLPTFTPEEERALVDHYCNAPRPERLAMHRRGVELHRQGWPWREADLSAMREHRERAP